MFPQSVNAILVWLHIFSAIAWMGTAMFFAIVMGPLLSQLSAPTRTELIPKLFPKLSNYVTAFSSLTLIFGVLLAIGVTNSFEELSASNRFGFNITSGALLAVAAIVIAQSMVVRSARKIVKAVKGERQVSPAEVTNLQKRMRMGSAAVLVLLALALIFMVTAVNPY